MMSHQGLAAAAFAAVLLLAAVPASAAARAPPGLANPAAPRAGFKMSTWRVPRETTFRRALEAMTATPSEAGTVVQRLSSNGRLPLKDTYHQDYVVRYIACLKVAQPGLYKFWTASSDGGSALWINDRLVVGNNDGSTSETRRTATNVKLAKGYVLLKVAYWKRHGRGAASLDAGWAGPSFGNRQFTPHDVEQAEGEGQYSQCDNAGLESKKAAGAFRYPEERMQLEYEKNSKLAVDPGATSLDSYDQMQQRRKAVQLQADARNRAADKASQAKAVDEQIQLLKEKLHPGLNKAQIEQAQKGEATLVADTLKAVAAAKNDFETILNNGTCVGANCSKIALHAPEPSGVMNVAQLLNDKIKRSNITINTTVPSSKPANQSDTMGYKGNYVAPKSPGVPINTPWAGDSTAPPTEFEEDLEAAELLSLS